MKVIGKTKENGGDYIAVVSHTELQKLSNRYYGSSELEPLKIGGEMDLGAGYNFRNEIQRCCKQMEDATKAFHDAQATMLRFAVMVGQLPPEAPVDQS